MIRADTENIVNCSSCQKPSILREVFIVQDKLARKIAYETHSESIISEEHIAALTRAENFYKKVFDLINEFNGLPDETKIVKVENAAGKLTELDFFSMRPTACAVRTTIVPEFTLKTFGKSTIISLEPRQLNDTTLDQLMSEIAERAKPYIEDARDKNIMGLG